MSHNSAEAFPNSALALQEAAKYLRHSNPLSSLQYSIRIDPLDSSLDSSVVLSATGNRTVQNHPATLNMSGLEQDDGILNEARFDFHKARVFTVDSTFRRCWNLLIFMLVCYNAIVVPLRLAFFGSPAYLSDDSTNLSALTIWCMVDSVLDIFFWVDIWLHRRYFPSKPGQTDPKAITTNYYREGFRVDIVSSLPYGLLSLVAFASPGSSADELGPETEALRLWFCLRLPLLFRLLKFSHHFHSVEMYLFRSTPFHWWVDAAAVRLIKLAALFALALHFMVCYVAV